ncbi:MAG: dTDP-3-amino-3,4,6-trideoxy-alpha-D-glucose transaminase [Nitrosomonadaceae bacterium]|nr:dTDP-3-amino-3,4,6-trideoxy-alpha-D-glucose transaminase [Nitrosomonadaceae bacterium]
MTVLQVPYVDIPAQWVEDRDRLLPVIERVLGSGNYILGDAVEQFESAVARFCEVQHCVAVNSGTDALMLALSALGIGRGDEVITPPNSFISSTAAVAHLGATPVFVDVMGDQSINPEAVRKAITPKTKAIMPVHLTGRLCRMDELETLSEESGVPIVEDSAQSIGSRFLGRPSGSWGVAGCFSGHPLKNLAAIGDAGFLVTSSPTVAEHARRLRNHGLVDRNIVQSFGVVSRLDSLKAAILLYRLERLDSVISRRRFNAAHYFAVLTGSDVALPFEREPEYNTYHTFVIQVDERDRLKNYLESHGVGTTIHYPVPIHLQPAARRYHYERGSFPVCEEQANRILSLPIHQHLRPEEIEYVASCIRNFYGN